LLSHDLAHTPSPHLAQAAAVGSWQPPARHGSPNMIAPKATAKSAATISKVLRSLISPSFFEAWESGP
jgi:hypothetical protein